MDRLVAIFILLFLSPLFFIVLIFLFYYNKGNIFFIQERTGYKMKSFKIIKFKTMNDFKDQNNKLLPDAQRIHKVGKILRRYSLDEIPQLFNVIAGKMSIVGPRPLLPEYVPLYDAYQRQRHLVKPGITGWAQVNGRNAISWQEKFKLDIWYVENLSFLVDVKILFKTVVKVILADNISMKNHVSAEPFKGN